MFVWREGRKEWCSGGFEEKQTRTWAGSRKLAEAWKLQSGLAGRKCQMAGGEPAHLCEVEHNAIRKVWDKEAGASYLKIQG